MKVVIIGGVAGGASAAARLRRLDENAQIINIGARTTYIICQLWFAVLCRRCYYRRVQFDIANSSKFL